MRTFVARVSRRGQLTIPVEVRRVLGLYLGGEVIFELDGEQVPLEPGDFTLESAFGSVRPVDRPEDFEAIAERAREEYIEGIVREGRDLLL